MLTKSIMLKKKKENKETQNNYSFILSQLGEAFGKLNILLKHYHHF